MKSFSTIIFTFFLTQTFSQNLSSYVMNEASPNHVYFAPNPDEDPNNGANNWQYVGNLDIYNFRNVGMSKIGDFLYIAGQEALSGNTSGPNELYRYDLNSPESPAQLVNTFEDLTGDQGLYSLDRVVGLSLDFDGNMIILGNGPFGTTPIIFAVDPGSGTIKRDFYGPGNDYVTLVPRDSDDGQLQYLNEESLAISSCDGAVFGSLSVYFDGNPTSSTDYICEIDLETGEYNALSAVNLNTDGLSYGGPNNTLFSSNSSFIFNVNESTGALTQLDDLANIDVDPDTPGTQVASPLDLEGLDFEIARPATLISDEAMIDCSSNTTVRIFDNDEDPNDLLDYMTLTFTDVPHYYSVNTNSDNTEVIITQNSPSAHPVDEIKYTVVSEAFSCVAERTLEGTILVQSACLLPIELGDFSVEDNDDDAIISWTTLSESNNDYFALEYSLNGTDFDQLATINGAGNSTETLQYQYTHENVSSLQTTQVYYRLVQIDFDGDRKASDIIILNLQQSHDVKIYPVPAKRGQLVTVTGKELQSYTLYNSWGQVVQARDYSSNQTAIAIQTGNLSPGVYLLQTNDGKVVKLVIQ